MPHLVYSFKPEYIYQFTGELDKADLTEFLAIFIKNYGNKLAEFNNAVAIERLHQAQSAAHSMKSSLKIVGAQSLSRLCEEFEQATKKSHDETSLLKLANDITRQGNDVLTELNHHYKQLQI